MPITFALLIVLGTVGILDVGWYHLWSLRLIATHSPATNSSRTCPAAPSMSPCSLWPFPRRLAAHGSTSALPSSRPIGSTPWWTPGWNGAVGPRDCRTENTWSMWPAASWPAPRPSPATFEAWPMRTAVTALVPRRGRSHPLPSRRHGNSRTLVRRLRLAQNRVCPIRRQGRFGGRAERLLSRRALIRRRTSTTTTMPIPPPPAWASNGTSSTPVGWWCGAWRWAFSAM